MNRKLAVVLLAVLAVAMPLSDLWAAEYLPKDPKQGGNVVVQGEKEFRNLYVAGGSVIINQEIRGDLFAGGGSVNVAQPVEKDLLAAGGNITVSSSIGEDVRMAGGNLVVNAPIGGDLLLAGGTVSISKDARIGGDLWAAGGVVNLTSEVAGNGKIAGGEIFINGAINGALIVRADKKLVFGPKSQVTGPITYYGPQSAVVEEGAQVGAIEFKRVEKMKSPAAGGFGAVLIFKLVALLVAGLVVFKLFGKTALSIITSSYNQFWSNLGIGVLGLMATPIIVILLMVTAVGAYVGIILALWFAFAVLMGGIFSVMFTGAVVEKWIRKKPELELDWASVIWGAVTTALLALVPVVGWLAILILFLLNFGGLLRAVRGRLEF